jgi:hypothetical protein
MVRDAMDPRMMQTVMITTAEYAQAHPDIIKGLIVARREGLAYMMEHPDEPPTSRPRPITIRTSICFARISTISSRKNTGATAGSITPA